MEKKRVIIYIVAILIVASFLRLYALDSTPPGFYHDEAMNGNNALEALETNQFKWFYSENNGREGLYVNIVAFSLKIFGNESWAVRLVSALFGILTVLGLYFLVKELFRKERIALIASFLIATSFWHILFSRIAFRAIMAPMFLVWAFALIFMASRKKSWILAALGGFSFGLGFHTYIAFRIAPLLLIFPFYLLFKKRQFKLIAIFLLFAFIAGLPLGIYFLKNPQDFFGRTSQISVFSEESPIKALSVNVIKTLGMFFVVGDFNWRHNFAGYPALWWPVSILFLFGTIVAVKRIRKTSKNFFNFSFLFFWIAVMLLPVVISSEGLPHALRAIIVIPPVFIFAALGLEIVIKKVKFWILKKIQKYPKHKTQLLRIRKKLVILLFILFIAIAANTFTKYFISWGRNIHTYHAFNGRYFDIGKYFNQLSQDTPKYVIVNASGVLARGIPMPAQTVMFATNTYTEKRQEEMNITYLLPTQIDSIECNDSCVISTLEIDGLLRDKIKNEVKDLQLIISPSIEILKK
jgi:4-amino-4-deoxy-L-arabinose transferase-like glycosyltransferase